MRITNHPIGTFVSLLFCAVILVAVIGHTKEISPPVAGAASVSVSAPNAPAPAAVETQNSYVYFPNYEVYYDTNRHVYRYQLFPNGNAWVTRSVPPLVSAEVLLASPSVRMDYHDTPERHHDSVARKYPKDRAPLAANFDNKDEGESDRKNDGERAAKGAN
jgi:hypothetical protein